jgi:hypothetical protein
MNIHHLFLFLLLSLSFSYSYNCSWNYRFDSIDNHFNIVYPDDNAVYFGMIVPNNTNNLTISTGIGLPKHPAAKYFSIQIYNIGNLVESVYHLKDVDILMIEDLMDETKQYALTLMLDSKKLYFALFRIYDSLFTKRRYNDVFYYWSGFPPRTFINSNEYSLCDVDYNQQGNIYTNLTKGVSKETGTVCIENDTFMFMEAPPGSLMNVDANYMIACIKPNTYYNVSIKVPRLMCSVGYSYDSYHPWINETYDLRYASLSIVSTTAPRPTIKTYAIPCDISVYTIQIYVNDSVPLPGLLYRQLLPDPKFQESIASAKEKCYDYVNSIYDIYCIQLSMGSYYPELF